MIQRYISKKKVRKSQEVTDTLSQSVGAHPADIRFKGVPITVG